MWVCVCVIVIMIIYYNATQVGIKNSLVKKVLWYIEDSLKFRNRRLTNTLKIPTSKKLIKCQETLENSWFWERPSDATLFQLIPL